MGFVGGYRDRARGALRTAFSEDHPPKQIAASFAVGVFVTALPTLGTGVIVLGWIGYRFEWANRLALVASVAILNPMAKGAVYVASYATGVALLGPVPGATRADIGLDAGVEVVVRLLVGNAVLAAAFAVVGYVFALRAVHAYRRRGE